MVHTKLDRFPSNYFTGDDWLSFWSSNISLNRSVSQQHVLAVTSVFPHWVSSYVKTTIQYIWQCVSSLNLAGLIFSFSLLLLLSLFFFFAPSSLLFFFFLPFSRSPSLRPRTQHFPTECGAEGWAIVSCYRETGREEEAGWLPGCQLDFYVSVRKSRRDRSDDDRGTVYPRDWLQLEKYRFCYVSHTVAPK